MQAVLKPSEVMPTDARVIQGHDFNRGCSLDSLMASMLTTGLQASSLGQAIDEVNRMVRVQGSLRRRRETGSKVLAGVLRRLGHGRRGPPG